MTVLLVSVYFLKLLILSFSQVPRIHSWIEFKEVYTIVLSVWILNKDLVALIIGRSREAYLAYFKMSFMDTVLFIILSFDKWLLFMLIIHLNCFIFWLFC